MSSVNTIILAILWLVLQLGNLLVAIGGEELRQGQGLVIFDYLHIFGSSQKVMELSFLLRCCFLADLVLCCDYPVIYLYYFGWLTSGFILYYHHAWQNSKVPDCCEIVWFLDYFMRVNNPCVNNIAYHKGKCHVLKSI